MWPDWEILWWHSAKMLETFQNLDWKGQLNSSFPCYKNVGELDQTCLLELQLNGGLWHLQFMFPWTWPDLSSLHVHIISSVLTALYKWSVLAENRDTPAWLSYKRYISMLKTLCSLKPLYSDGSERGEMGSFVSGGKKMKVRYATRTSLWSIWLFGLVSVQWLV